jgi:hypothetical protein
MPRKRHEGSAGGGLTPPPFIRGLYHLITAIALQVSPLETSVISCLSEGKGQAEISLILRFLSNYYSLVPKRGETDFNNFFLYYEFLLRISSGSLSITIL